MPPNPWEAASRDDDVEIARQRGRLLAAMTAVAGEHGWERTTLQAVVARAGVSRRTLYDLFEGKQDCFLAAARSLTERVAALTRDAYTQEREPRAGLAQAVRSLLSFCAGDPPAARVYLVETAIAGDAGATLWHQHMDEMSEQTACALGAVAPRLPQHSATMTVGGVYTIARTRVLAGRTGELAGIAPEVERALWLTLGIEARTPGGRAADG